MTGTATATAPAPAPETAPAAFDWDALAPAEAAPVSVSSTGAPFDGLSLPAAIRNRVEEALISYVSELAAYVAKGNNPANLKYDWKVQAFPTLEMANKFVTWAKKYGKFRPAHELVYPDPEAQPQLAEGVTLPSGQITVRAGKPGPYTPPGADKPLHEIAVRYIAKPLEKSDTTNLPGTAAGQNGTAPAAPAAPETPPAA